MTLPEIFGLAGLATLGVSLVGGNVTIAGVAVPTLNKPTRYVCYALAPIFFGTAIYLYLASSEAKPTKMAMLEVSAKLEANNHPDAKAKYNLQVEDKQVASFDLSAAQPEGSASFQIPATGVHPFTLSASRMFTANKTKKPHTVTETIRGYIDASKWQNYTIHCDDDNSHVYLTAQ